MIMDRIENWRSYKLGTGWEAAASFLVKAGEDIALGRHDIKGDDLFARVMKYKTKPAGKGQFEAHRKYVDVQFLLKGAEAIDWAPLCDLDPKSAYDRKDDGRLYHNPRGIPTRLILKPGLFAVFFPEDGHAPGLISGAGPRDVKKIVLKVKTDLLLPSRRG